VKSVRLFIKVRQSEGAGLQLEVVNNQAPTFHVQDFHAGAKAVNKDEHLAILHIAVHQVGHNSTQGIETLPHIRGIGVEVILHGRCQTEHAIQRVGSNNDRSVSRSTPPLNLSWTPFG